MPRVRLADDVDPSLPAGEEAGSAPQLETALDLHLGRLEMEGRTARSHRKTPLYGNCRLVDPEGTVLCYCGRKRLEWFAERRLGWFTDSRTLRLAFKPKGKGRDGEPYFMEEKQNMCVVCGDKDKILRFRVVPHCYRRHFPEALKSRASYDLLLMCLACTEKADRPLSRMQKQISIKFNAPLNPERKLSEWTREYKRMAGFARAIITSGQKIPRNRMEEMTNDILQFAQKCRNMFSSVGLDIQSTDIASLSLQSIQTIAREFLETKVEDEEEHDKSSTEIENLNHGKAVVDALLNSPEPQKALHEFIRDWRKHFLDEMKPNFLSPHWSIDYRDPKFFN